MITKKIALLALALLMVAVVPDVWGMEKDEKNEQTELTVEKEQKFDDIKWDKYKDIKKLVFEGEYINYFEEDNTTFAQIPAKCPSVKSLYFKGMAEIKKTDNDPTIWADNMPAFENVTEIYVGTIGSKESFNAMCKACPKLETIILPSNNGIEALEWKEAKNLKNFKITKQSNANLTFNAMNKIISEVKGLETLDLNNISLSVLIKKAIPSEHWQKIKNVKLLQKLEQDEENMTILLALCPNLEKLIYCDKSNAEITMGKKDIEEQKKKICKLEKIHWCCSSLDDPTTKRLLTLCPNLEKITYRDDNGTPIKLCIKEKSNFIKSFFGSLILGLLIPNLTGNSWIDTFLAPVIAGISAQKNVPCLGSISPTTQYRWLHSILRPAGFIAGKLLQKPVWEMTKNALNKNLKIDTLKNRW